MSCNVAAHQGGALGQLGQTWGSHEGCSASLVPLLSKSQLMLENRWPGMWGRGGRGGRGRGGGCHWGEVRGWGVEVGGVIS